MCAIIDANVISEVFRSESLGEKGARPQAGKQFFDWLYLKPERLVIGGSKLRKELNSESFLIWMQEADRSGNGKPREYDDKEVDKKAKELRDQKACKSDDEHIIALAQISKARLLYSKDKTLHKDFKNSTLLDDPMGKIFPRGNKPQDRGKRDDILSDESLCRK